LRAASGHAAAAPPISVMNSRRLTSSAGNRIEGGSGAGETLWSFRELPEFQLVANLTVAQL
jgi:hypothetical protein